MLLLLFLLPIALAAQNTILLEQAEAISHFYSADIAKAPPPALFPQSDACLAQASIWFRVDASPSTLEPWMNEASWRIVRDLGVEALSFHPSQENHSFWAAFQMQAEKEKISLIGSIIGNSTPPNSDFEKALQAIGDYPSLYQLIEVDPSDWKLLPPLTKGACPANIPWLSLQELHKKGYVPEQFTPYIKASAWNATGKIVGADGKSRRWIYLKENEMDPVFDWLSPTFSAYRLASGDALKKSFEKGEKFLKVDAALPQMAQEMLALWIRKIGSFSVASASGTLEELRHNHTDLIADAATPSPFLHALITQDAEALRVIYRLFLEEGIESKRLVHTLEPFSEDGCGWYAFLNLAKKQLRYREEMITAEVLRRRLLKEDLIQLSIPAQERIPVQSWVDGCARALRIKDFQKHKDEIMRAHLLIAFAYAMQPGVFSFSLDDLVGILPGQSLEGNLLDANDGALYSSVPIQLKNPRSFASQLKAILQTRTASKIAFGELVDVPKTSHDCSLILVHRLPKTRFIQVLALNFGKESIQESIDIASIRQTTAIDLMSNLAEEKIFSSSQFSFIIPPLSGRVFYFQPKYYD